MDRRICKTISPKNQASPRHFVISSGSTVNVRPQISCDGNDVVWYGTDAMGVQQIYKNGVVISSGSTNNFDPQISCDGSDVVWRGTDAMGVLQIYKYSDCCGISDISHTDPLPNNDGTFSITVSYAGDDPNVTISGGLNASPATYTASGSVCDNPCEPIIGEVTFTYPCGTDTEITFSGDCAIDSIPVSFDSCEITVVPTIGQWGLICLGLLLLIVGVTSVKSREIALG